MTAPHLSATEVVSVDNIQQRHVRGLFVLKLKYQGYCKGVNCMQVVSVDNTHGDWVWRFV